MKCFVLLLMLLFPGLSFGWTAHVELTAGESDQITGVFVTETAGDYSASYGQLSEPGAMSVAIGNIKPLTTYYFSAKRYDPETWESSCWSAEVEYTTAANIKPVVHELPTIVLEGVELNITVTVN